MRAFPRIVLLAVALATACTHTFPAPSQPVSGYPSAAPIPLDVELWIPKALRDAKWERGVSGDTWLIPLGGYLATSCEDVVGRVFRNVALASGEENRTRPGPGKSALVVPRLVVLTAGLSPGLQPLAVTAKVEWTVTDHDGKLRWVETVTGANHTAGSSDKVIAAAMNDLFRRSFEALRGSPEVAAIGR